MASAAVRTLLPLDRFFRLVGVHPLHVNQVVFTNNQPQTCGAVLFQQAWQNADAMAREEIAHAIAQAEGIIAEQVGYKLLPTWEVDEVLQFNNTKGWYTWPWGHAPAYEVAWKHVLSGGIEAKSLILAGRPITYTDPDGDGYFELATITCATTVTEPEEIAIYYPGESGSDEWEIRPISVVISGGTATITCRREQLVAKNLLIVLDPEAVDGSVVGNFLTTVDVYRHYNDPQTQVQFMWEGGCSCGESACHACTYTVQNGCLLVRNPRLGFVAGSPADWNAESSAFDSALFSACRSPDKARVWYRAGLRYRNSVLTMHPQWERVVANLALTLMDRPFCGCTSLEHVTRLAKEDFALQKVDGDSYRVSRFLLENPIGTTRGAIEAWRMIQTSRVGESARV